MKKIKAPWNQVQPEYDDRTSCYVNVGSHYGVGKNQPVGSLSHSMKGEVPKGRPTQMRVDEVPRKNLPIEVCE